VSQSLAILGGPPRFAEPLHVGRPNKGDRERFLARVAEMWDRNWLTNDGPLVREFEAAIARESGVPHCVAMCNGTIALEIAIRALGLTGEVIVPAYTFVATPHALQWQGITPVFCDVDPRTHNIDPRSAEAALSPATTGILGVHLWGRPCSDDLQGLADERGIPLLFDAAHAFACGTSARQVGSFGKAEVLSFHATKFVNSFEGGGVLTRDPDLDRRMRLMRNFGFAGFDNVVHVGTNGKLPEVSAAMGLTSLESLPEIVETNRRHHAHYSTRLGTIPGLRVMDYTDVARHNHQYVVIEVGAEDFGLTRDELLRALQHENILARRYFFPGCHRMAPYRDEPRRHSRVPLPVTERLCETVLLLPTGTAVSAGEIDAVCDVIQEAESSAEAIRRAIAHSTS